MAATTFINSPLELTTILIRHHGIHRGLWTLSVNFHVQGTNIRENGPDGLAFPGAWLPSKASASGRSRCRTPSQSMRRR